MLTNDDVGRRVVVRRVVDTGTARPAYTDTIGQLIRADESGLVVRPDRGGADVTIEQARVVAAKPVPPRRRRVTVEELERIAAETWPAVHRDRLGDWLLRAAGGWTGRANSALVVGDPGLPVRTALDQVTSWYAGHGLPPRCQLPLPAADDVDALLADRGWAATPDTLMLTAPIDRVRRTARPAGLPPVTLSARPSDAALAVFRAQERGLPPDGFAVLTGGDPTFAEIRDDGELVAFARAAVYDGHLGVTAVEVLPAHRRRGLARHLLGALTDASYDRAHTVFLQVLESNAPALALYGRFAFRRHHSYRYRQAPAS